MNKESPFLAYWRALETALAARQEPPATAGEVRNCWRTERFLTAADTADNLTRRRAEFRDISL